jgi:hypothetical protein
MASLAERVRETYEAATNHGGCKDSQEYEQCASFQAGETPFDLGRCALSGEVCQKHAQAEEAALEAYRQGKGDIDAQEDYDD